MLLGQEISKCLSWRKLNIPLEHFDKNASQLLNFNFSGGNYFMKLRIRHEEAEWINLDSDAAQKVRYHRGSRLLDIQYVNGDIYRYENTTPTEFRDLLHANSTGNYLNRVFKPRHPVYRKIRF
jgi:hypothetical protein